MITCPRCGYQAPDDSSYCPNCGYGKPITPSASEPCRTIVCPHCGCQAPYPSQYCPNCGLSFNLPHAPINTGFAQPHVSPKKMNKKSFLWLAASIAALGILAAVVFMVIIPKLNDISAQKQFKTDYLAVEKLAEHAAEFFSAESEDWLYLSEGKLNYDSVSWNPKTKNGTIRFANYAASEMVSSEYAYLSFHYNNKNHLYRIGVYCSEEMVEGAFVGDLTIWNSAAMHYLSQEQIVTGEAPRYLAEILNVAEKKTFALTKTLEGKYVSLAGGGISFTYTDTSLQSK